MLKVEYDNMMFMQSWLGDWPLSFRATNLIKQHIITADCMVSLSFVYEYMYVNLILI